MIAIAGLIDRASHWLARISMLLVVAMTVAFIAALLLQVFYRYALNAPLTWSEELATLLFVWATLLAAATAIRTNDTLRLTFIEDALAPRRAAVLRAIQQVLVIVFGVILILNGWRLAQLVWSNTSAAMGYPGWMLYLAVPVTGALLILHAAARLVRPPALVVEVMP